VTAIATMASEVLALAQAEEDLLEAAVREHSRLVYRIAYSVLRDRADAEDATQETFLRVLRYEKKFARIDNPKAWLARIAWRVAVERRRQVVRAGAKMEQAGVGLPSPGAEVERILLEQERSALLDRLIAALPRSNCGILWFCRRWRRFRREKSPWYWESEKRPSDREPTVRGRFSRTS
jgi:RNA polymerase sigma-70 factor, ECF subfamily